MSDTSQGDGWWIASDGKWYPPESAPQAAPAVLPPPGAVARAVPTCSRGLRFGAYLLEILLVIVTLFIGWVIWSLIIWGEGKTPAKKVLGMTCVKLDTGQSAAWGTMFVREIVGKWLLSAITAGISGLVSAIMILFVDDRRGIWDHLAGTVVVKDADYPALR
jgi:uncharacterized RDD family membrane protein YckC